MVPVYAAKLRSLGSSVYVPVWSATWQPHQLAPNMQTRACWHGSLPSLSSGHVLQIGDLRGAQSLLHVAGMTIRNALQPGLAKVSTIRKQAQCIMGHAAM